MLLLQTSKIFQFFLKREAGETARLARCLLCKNEDLSLAPQHSCEKAGHGGDDIYNPGAGSTAGGSLRLSGPSVYLNEQGPSLVKDPI